MKKLNIWLSMYKKIITIINIRAVLYNWKTANRMETGFSLNNRPKRLVYHYARSSHRFLTSINVS